MKPIIAFVFCLLLCVPSLHAESHQVSAKLKELVKLRVQVDTISHELAQARAQEQDHQRAAAAQISHLELQIRQEKLRNAILLKERKKALEVVQEEQSKRDALTTPLRETIEVLRNHVTKSLPYQQSRRLQTLEQIEKELLSANGSAATSLSKLLQFAEDERTLTQEIGIGQQVVTIGGGDVLVDVAHVGMAALYFVTSDKRYGWALWSNDHYTYQLFNSPEESQAAQSLFETLQSNQRTGYMQLPLQYIAPQGGL